MITPFLEYLLKANIAITVFYVFYRLFLRSDTFYVCNRVYFMVSIAIAAIFPFVDFSVFFPAAQPLIHIPVISPDVDVVLTGSNSLTTADYITMGVVTVAAILLLRFMVQLGSLARLYKVAQKGEIHNQKLLIITDNANPFSFFRWIFVNPQLHNDDDLRQIITHEHVHVMQWHSADIVVYELVSIVCWYNPFVWLMRKAMKQNIEFLADKHTLRAGYDRRHYQYNLLKVSQIPMLSGIVNNFNFNHLKNRIMMMNKKQSTNSNMLKFTLVLPVFVFVALLVNAKPRQIIAPLMNAQEQLVPDTLYKPVNVGNPSVKKAPAEVDKQDSRTKVISKLVPSGGDKTNISIVEPQNPAEEEVIVSFGTMNAPQQKNPAIAFDKDTHDFGTIIETDGKVSALFTFTNVGGAPVVINNVVPSCGCTTPEWTKEPVQPGKVGYVRATYDPTGRVVPFDKIITVSGNFESGSVVLHIKGTVVKQ